MARDFDPNIPQDWSGWWILNAGYPDTVFTAQDILDMSNSERRDLYGVFITYYEYLYDQDMANVRQVVQNRNQVKFAVNDLIDGWMDDYRNHIADGSPASSLVMDFDNREVE